jgi:alkanesulfonate monooxygenase SsuD/methylene tetrahydromethanopterin reductase-like flavin-dependent oxidoreductase (luciferase family)
MSGHASARTAAADVTVRCVVRVHQAGMPFAHLLAIWREADALGYDGGSLYDLIGAPALECWTTLTALTMATRRLRAIPLVLAVGYRHPALLAKMAATLDDISGGRLVLGLGSGGDRRDHERAGLPWQPARERAARLEDAVAAIRHLWTGSASVLRTRHYGDVAGPGRPRPAQQPGPPVLIGGHGERYLLRAAARTADLCNVGFDMSLEEWAAKTRLLRRYCEDAGRDPATLVLTHNATVLLARDTAEAEAKAEALVRARGVDPVAARRRLAHAMVGTPDHCAERLRAYAAAGVRWFFLLFPDVHARAPAAERGTLGPDLSSLRLFAREVLPALRGAPARERPDA